MQLQNWKFPLLIHILVSLCSCNNFVQSYVKLNLDSLPSTSINPSLATVTITTPSTSNKIAGWNILLRGTCSDNGTPVEIKDNGLLLSTTAPCVGNTWGKFVDISSALPGSVLLTITQLDVNGVRSNPANVTIQKISNACDSAANRAKNYAAGLAGGLGTISSPYIICTADQLQQIRNGTSSNSYTLYNDIDFSNGDTNGDTLINGTDANYVSGTGWPTYNFDGDRNSSYFEGNNFEIRGLTINEITQNVGLFSSIIYREVKNLSILDANITGLSSAVLSPNCTGSIIDNVHISGTVNGLADYIGGICAQGGYILNSSSISTINGTGFTAVGGILGGLTNGLVANSSFSGTVTGRYLVGGIVGNSYGGTPNLVVNSYSSGTISGVREVGGLIGSYGTARNCYTSANVNQIAGAGTSYIGGLGGYGTTVINSFSTGNVTAGTSPHFGALVGSSLPTIVNSYYWSGATVSGTGAQYVHGTPVATLADFYNKLNPPLNSWDYIGSDSDGFSDHWVETTSNFPRSWWTNNSSYTAPFAGLGTTLSPYLIASAVDFQKISSNPRLMGKVFQMTATTTMTNFTPIALDSVFYGSFLGNNQIIDYVGGPINYGSQNWIGLFGIASLATIQDLEVNSVNITGTGSNIGILVGSARSVQVTRVNTKGSVAGTDYIGGLIGSASFGSINRSTSSASATATATSVGGLVGNSGSTNIYDSYATGSVGSVTASRVGGLVGDHNFGIIDRSYATGNCTGTSFVGGLIGNKSGNIANYVRNSFALGIINANSASGDVGLFIGSISDSVNSINNYVSATGSCTNSGGAGCNTVLFSTQPNSTDFYNSTNAPLTSWDFTTIWFNNLGLNTFPTLR